MGSRAVVDEEIVTNKSSKCDVEIVKCEEPFEKSLSVNSNPENLVYKEIRTLVDKTSSAFENYLVSQISLCKSFDRNESRIPPKFFNEIYDFFKIQFTIHKNHEPDNSEDEKSTQPTPNTEGTNDNVENDMPYVKLNESALETDIIDESMKDSIKSDSEKTIFDENASTVLSEAKTIVNNCVFYTCPICNKSLRSAHTFIFHMRIHSGEKPCVCHICGKQFRISAGLRRHLKETHHKIKDFSCDTCDQKFVNKQNLVQHKRIHTGERPYVCTKCGKGFKQSGSLYIHSKTHTDNYPYECNTCDAKFRSRAQLTHHTYKHTGEKPNVCDVCGRAFRVKYELNIHKLVHTDEKPFSCKDCGVSFRQKRYLRNHCKKSHNNIS